MTDRILGLVGGVGPESTLDYYRRLVDGWHARRGPDSHPRLLVNSIDGGAVIGPMVATAGHYLQRRVHGSVHA